MAEQRAIWKTCQSKVSGYQLLVQICVSAKRYRNVIEIFDSLDDAKETGSESNAGGSSSVSIAVLEYFALSLAMISE